LRSARAGIGSEKACGSNDQGCPGEANRDHQQRNGGGSPEVSDGEGKEIAELVRRPVGTDGGEAKQREADTDDLRLGENLNVAREREDEQIDHVALDQW